ncbi:hypothetical protein RHGRI_009795 [Rhododendron griersonianum]|uniref:Uncharacterized protein n=1 Tax=Rhododendron griersonianum TaxID=479676 RepID=A0AAV6KH85_9ERIC|nr:hypothetical protein RHGRI_009795 [Rhododendron griersonianum]
MPPPANKATRCRRRLIWSLFSLPGKRLECELVFIWRLSGELSDFGFLLVGFFFFSVFPSFHLLIFFFDRQKKDSLTHNTKNRANRVLGTPA